MSSRYGTRILPPDEWHRLAGLDAGTLVNDVLPADNRDDIEVLVVEREGAIVACWVLMRVLHAECVYIAPAQRCGRGGVVLRLLRGMKARVRALGRRTFVTAPETDQVRGLLDRLGTRLPGTHYVVKV